MRDAVSSVLIFAGLALFAVAAIARSRVRRTGVGLAFMTTSRAAAIGLAASLGVCTAGGAVAPQTEPVAKVETIDTPTTSSKAVVRKLHGGETARTSTTREYPTSTTAYVAPTTQYVPPTTRYVPPTTRYVPPTTRYVAPAQDCPNGTYTNSSGNEVCSPYSSPDGPPAGATARCKDGTYSFSEHRQGTCSGHGGVAEWY